MKWFTCNTETCESINALATSFRRSAYVWSKVTPYSLQGLTPNQYTYIEHTCAGAYTALAIRPIKAAPYVESRLVSITQGSRTIHVSRQWVRGKRKRASFYPADMKYK